MLVQIGESEDNMEQTGSRITHSQCDQSYGGLNPCLSTFKWYICVSTSFVSDSLWPPTNIFKYHTKDSVWGWLSDIFAVSSTTLLLSHYNSVLTASQTGCTLNNSYTNSHTNDTASGAFWVIYFISMYFMMITTIVFQIQAINPNPVYPKQWWKRLINGKSSQVLNVIVGKYIFFPPL